MKFKSIWLFLIGSIIFLELAYIVAFKTQKLLFFFDLNGEANIPVWFTSSLFAFSAALSLFSATRQSNWDAKHFWNTLGLACAFISLDETAQIHEQITYLTNIKWIYFYAPAGVIVIAMLTRYFFKHYNDHPNLQIIGAGVLVGFVFSVGLEAISYFGFTSLWQKVEFMLEEGAEMLGAGAIMIGVLHEVDKFLKKSDT
ncbi:MAG: hypothetical protein Kow002_19530 [Anaerolineales bacterium]